MRRVLACRFVWRGCALARGRGASHGVAVLPRAGRLESLSAKLPWAMWPRKRIDISYDDIAFTLGKIATTGEADRARVTRDVERAWSPAGDAIVCLSVRWVATQGVCGCSAHTRRRWGAAQDGV
jgi:hypothetical protein